MNTVDDLAHELWAIAQGRAPISDVVDVMTPTLRAALSAEYERGRSERYTGTPKSDPDYEHSEAAPHARGDEPGRDMTDILERLYAVCETGPDPDVIYAAADEIKQLRAAADAVLHEAQFYGACYGTTQHGREAMEHLASILRPNVKFSGHRPATEER